MTGATISHYQILEKLGEGGMGVVYKARDLRLDRFVSIKILRPEQLKDESRKQRFIQEAKSASSLNHPNIITIHEIDQADGIDFMVMEFVAGKTLEQWIPGGGMPVADVLRYAIPIARALAAANAAGIIHRDVKPGNIMVGANGIVKVLDFGLAKLAVQEVSAEDETRIKGHTAEGTIVGTAAYMSPEQAQGRPVDGRSDIFSIGAVLYEMLSGGRAFQGANAVSTLAAILEKEPAPLSGRDSRIPRELERVVMRCLRKDPERRFQTMGDLRAALEELKDESDSGKLTPAQPARETQRRKWLVPGLSAALVLLAVAGGWLWWRSRPAKTIVRPVTRLTFNGVSNYPAISPDGKLLAYQATINGANPDIWMQQIGGGKAIQITHEKDGAFSPAFSPDGTQVAYSSARGIYEVTALGGDVRMIAKDGAWPAYLPDGSAILFWHSTGAHSYPFTIPRMGGTAVQIQPEFSYYFAAISPDGSKLLATADRNGGPQQDLKHWWLMPVPGGKPQEVAPPPLLPDETYAPTPLVWTIPDKTSGRQWVIFQRRIGNTRNLFRVAVASDGTVTAPPEQLTFTADSWAPSVSGNGRMVFLSGDLSTNVWSIPIDANRAQVTGDRQSLTQVEGLHDRNPSLSRDGKNVAFFSDRSIVVKEIATGRETELAQNVPAIPGTGPAISPDGSSVVYYANSASVGDWDLYSISTAGGAPRLVCRACGWPKGFSSDGSHVLTQRGFVTHGLDRIALVELATGKVTDVLSDPQYNLWHPYYSWDDRWMSFVMQTGVDHQHDRLYITPVENFVPAGRERWIQLTSGDHHDDKPQLSPDGNTIYFTSDRDGFMCMWAMRLDPRTKRPLGAPFAIQHFHGSQRVHSGISTAEDLELNVAIDKIVTSLDEVHSDIWMMDLEPQH